MSGQVIEGGVHGPGASFPAGTVFIGATFLATSTFGDGSIFIDCTWKKCCPKSYSNPPSQVGKGAVVTNGNLEKVHFDEGGVFESPTIGMDVNLGSAAAVDTGGKVLGITAGATHNTNKPGMVNTDDGAQTFDPCKIDPCDPNQQYPVGGAK